jgi:mRNA interferase HigB
VSLANRSLSQRSRAVFARSKTNKACLFGASCQSGIVRLITEKTVRQWIADHPSVKAQLTYWLEKMKGCTASNFTELKALFAGVDRVPVASGNPVIVFNVGHGKSAYRLVAAIHFDKQRAFALKFLSHAEYDKEVWKDQL